MKTNCVSVKASKRRKVESWHAARDKPGTPGATARFWTAAMGQGKVAALFHQLNHAIDINAFNTCVSML